MESQNDQRLHDLAGKLANIRQVTNDIYTQASDQGIIDTASETFNNVFTSVKGGAGRLKRAAASGHPVFKLAGIALSVIFLFYILLKFFR